MTLFKRVFGDERDEAGKTLDYFVFGSIIIGTAVGLYSSWLAAIVAVFAFIIGLFYGRRAWLIFKARKRMVELRRKIERGEY